uniref:Uncharacterized protein n=1 Tax=Oryza barthii TaxID=65489 RepID=A0A0D3GZT6_9ORYZ
MRETTSRWIREVCPWLLEVAGLLQVSKGIKRPDLPLIQCPCCHKKNIVKFTATTHWLPLMHVCRRMVLDVIFDTKKKGT